MRKLSNWLDSYLKYVDNTEPPYLFKIWTGISAIAAALQRKCSLQIGMNETFPNMFVILIGPSGAGKSRAINPAKSILRELGIKLAAQKATNEGLIRDLKDSIMDVQDADGVMHMHSSLTIFSSEFAVFLRHQNQALVDDLCDLYDCEDKWDYKPKGEEFRDEVIRPYLNILGGITPTTFRARLPQEAIGGGLTSRMICVYEEHPSRYIPIHFITPEEKQIHQDLVHDLEEIRLMKGEFKLSDKFIDIWSEWYMRARQYPPFKQPFLDGYNSRRPLHVLKMSMNLSAARSSDMIIKGEDITQAIRILEQTEIKMPQSFEGIGESKLAKVLVDVMKFIALRKKVTYADVTAAFYQDANRDELKRILQQLQDMNFLIFNSAEGNIEYLPEGEQ